MSEFQIHGKDIAYTFLCISPDLTRDELIFAQIGSSAKRFQNHLVYLPHTHNGYKLEARTLHYRFSSQQRWASIPLMRFSDH